MVYGGDYKNKIPGIKMSSQHKNTNQNTHHNENPKNVRDNGRDSDHDNGCDSDHDNGHNSDHDNGHNSDHDNGHNSDHDNGHNSDHDHKRKKVRKWKNRDGSNILLAAGGGSFSAVLSPTLLKGLIAAKQNGIAKI